jgi:transposase InsO family protein
VWSWDITKVRGPSAGIWYNLYLVLDIFSRKIVGWRIKLREDAALAEALIADSYGREGVVPGQLTLHADRGTPMTSKTVAELLLDLGVAKSHSRPTISNDNPYSESQFKTLKYGPSYPERFESLQAARRWKVGRAWRHTSFRCWGLLFPQAMHQRKQLQEPHNTNDGRRARLCQGLLFRCSVFDGWNARTRSSRAPCLTGKAVG